MHVPVCLVRICKLERQDGWDGKGAGKFFGFMQGAIINIWMRKHKRGKTFIVEEAN